MTTEDQIKRLLPQVTDRLAGLPNVVGFGIQPLNDGDPQGQLAVAVYVRKKLPLAQLAPSDVVPKKIGTTLDGEHVEAPTRVIEVGDIRPA
jgi:hypothetical protein